MVPMNERLVEDWLLKEMVAEGLIVREDDRYFFHGDRTIFEVNLTVRPVARYTTRLAEPAPDFGDDYRGYD